MNFAFEIRRESNPRGSKPRPHTVSEFNHSANRVYAIGTESSHHMWWKLLVPIVYARLAEWLRSETIWDRDFLPRGFNSLRISNAKIITNSVPWEGTWVCESVNTWEHLFLWCIPHSRTADCHAGPESLTLDPVHASPWPGVGRIPLYGYYHARLRLLAYMDR